MSDLAAPGPTSIMRSLTGARPGELKALALSFAFFFCVLCSYYIVRPLRDEMAVSLGGDFIQQSFLIVFVVMLAAVPLFGAIVAHTPRRLIVPVVYGFFILCLAGFWAMHLRGRPGTLEASVFYIWVNIFALFTVSLFWSVMSDVWNTEQAKRLFGVISLGGTIGALTGPLLIQALLKTIGSENLFLLSILFLTIALAASLALRPSRAQEPDSAAEKPEGGHILAGAINVWRSPYLFRIAIWIFVGNMVGIYFYLEQARILGDLLPGRDERILFLARMETATSVLTIIFEAFVTGYLLKTLGAGRTLALAPAFVVVALVCLLLIPSLGVIAFIMVASRAIGYGITNPAIRVLYTVVDPQDKYRAQNFNDTLVHRGGNALSSWLFNDAAKAAGIAAPVIAAAAIPLVFVWGWLCLDLGRRQEQRAGERQAGKPAQADSINV